MITLLGCQPRPDAVNPTSAVPGVPITAVGTHEFAVHQQLTIANHGPGQPEKQNLWVALIRTLLPYQEVLSIDVSPKKYSQVVDEYGNQYAEFDYSGQAAGITQTVTIDYQLRVYDVTYNLSACQGAMPDIFTQPELHIESANPQIISLADKLASKSDSVCQQVRAFYDYTASELVYTSNSENWGAQAALGPMGADCTEYTDLLMALSRAHGIPARYYEGLLYLDSATDAVAKIEHAWPDIYLPSIGFTAMDPTLGRIPVNRDTYFAHYTPDHIIVTMGVNPSVLRGNNYWSHLYWPGDSTNISVNGQWKIELTREIGQ